MSPGGWNIPALRSGISRSPSAWRWDGESSFRGSFSYLLSIHYRIYCIKNCFELSPKAPGSHTTIIRFGAVVACPSCLQGHRKGTKIKIRVGRVKRRKWPKWLCDVQNVQRDSSWGSADELVKSLWHNQKDLQHVVVPMLRYEQWRCKDTIGRYIYCLWRSLSECLFPSIDLFSTLQGSLCLPPIPP